MKKLLLLLILTPICIFAQEDKEKSVKDGFSLQIGAGILYGGNIGILADYQFILFDKLRLTPLLSVGVSDAGKSPNNSKQLLWCGYSSGFNFEFGKKHRLIIGSQYEGNSLLSSSDLVQKNYFGGISSIIGYKGTTNFGLIWQVYIGDFYSPDDNPYSSNVKPEHRSHFGLGIGYKF
jgi:hypothetical protein